MNSELKNDLLKIIAEYRYDCENAIWSTSATDDSKQLALTLRDQTSNVLTKFSERISE